MTHEPICFGSLQVSDKSEACHKCPCRAECVDGAYAFLDTWRDRSVIDVERQRIALVAQQLLRSTLPPKAISGASPATDTRTREALKTGNAAVKRAVARAEKAGKFALYERELRAGRNPGKKSWEIVLFDLLLRGNIARTKLVRTYIEDNRTAYTPGTARTRACTAIAMFEEALLLRADGDSVTLHPRLVSDHINSTIQRP